MGTLFNIGNKISCTNDLYAPIDENEFVWDGFTYKVIVIDYGSGNELAWLDRNLGASSVATAINDSQAYGDLYQWGRPADGHEKRDSETTTTLSTTDQPGHGDFIIGSSDWRNPQNDNLWQGVDGINNPFPPGWRLPTEAEWQRETDTWANQGYVGAINSELKLPTPGYRLNISGTAGSAGVINADGVAGFYWSSTISGTEAIRLSIGNGTLNLNSGHRARGYSIRCVRDMP